MLSSRILEAAKAVAISSEGVGARNCYRVGAVLFDGKRVVAAKNNTKKTHPLLLSYTKFPFLHAESKTIISHGIDNCSGLDLLVVRVHKNNELTMAEPCPTCKAFIKDANIRKTYYSDWTGNIQCL